MASFISEFLSQRRSHFLSVISLTLSFIVVMTLDYSCRMIKKLFEDIVFFKSTPGHNKNIVLSSLCRLPL